MQNGNVYQCWARCINAQQWVCCISALVLAAHCTLDSTLCYRHCLTRRQKSIWKHQCFPLVCVSNLCAERKAAFGNRRSRAPFKGWQRGLKSRWLPGSSPPKEPQRYLQEQQRWRRGRHVWAEADTIGHPLKGAIAALQRSHLNGSALSTHERRC